MPFYTPTFAKVSLFLLHSSIAAWSCAVKPVLAIPCTSVLVCPLRQISLVLESRLGRRATGCWRTGFDDRGPCFILSVSLFILLFIDGSASGLFLFFIYGAHCTLILYSLLVSYRFFYSGSSHQGA
ncbi:hypothetical protein OF83DRAFT_1108291 [Amylostereum chailletii]|nr:hypothetical protein OF83DRAFT_1108291 [Amylostereum chailletii]